MYAYPNANTIKKEGISDKSTTPCMGLCKLKPFQYTAVCAAALPRNDIVANAPAPYDLINKPDSRLSKSATEEEVNRA